MRPEAVRTELRALLTRAAEVEARRQRARDSRDAAATDALEAELRELWRAYVELEEQQQ